MWSTAELFASRLKPERIVRRDSCGSPLHCIATSAMTCVDAFAPGTSARVIAMAPPWPMLEAGIHSPQKGRRR